MGERGSGSINSLERCPPLDERPSSQILAVEVEKIEGKEHDPVRRLVDGRAQGLEVGDAVLILDDDLAIDQGRFAGQLAASLDHSL
jgi:hypothetical protein